MRAIAPIAAHMRGQIAAATRRRRRIASDPFTGLTYLSSTGAAGSYAQAANDLAAKVFLPGSVLGTATLLCWVRMSAIDATRYLFRVVPASGLAHAYGRFETTSSGRYRAAAVDNANSLTGGLPATIGSLFDGVAWVLCANVYAHGASDTATGRVATTENTATDVAPGAYDAAATFRVFDDATGSSRLAGAVRNLAVFSRALASAELVELNTLGPTHDLRVSSGNYTGGGPAHWWPGDGDSGTTVTDRGSVGGCNLTLNGGVTIETL